MPNTYSVESSPDPLDCLDEDAQLGVSSSPETALPKRVPFLANGAGPQTLPRRTSPTKKSDSRSSPLAYTSKSSARQLVYIPIDKLPNRFVGRNRERSADSGSSTSGSESAYEAESPGEAHSESGSDSGSEDEYRTPRNRRASQPKVKRASLIKKKKKKKKRNIKMEQSAAAGQKESQRRTSKREGSAEEEEEENKVFGGRQIKRRRIVSDEEDEDDVEDESTDPNAALRALIVPSPPPTALDEVSGDVSGAEGQGKGSHPEEQSVEESKTAETQQEDERGAFEKANAGTRDSASQPGDDGDKQLDDSVRAIPPTPPATAPLSPRHSAPENVVEVGRTEPTNKGDHAQGQSDRAAPNPIVSEVPKSPGEKGDGEAVVTLQGPEVPVSGEINAAAPPTTDTDHPEGATEAHPVDVVPDALIPMRETQPEEPQATASTGQQAFADEVVVMEEGEPEVDADAMDVDEPAVTISKVSSATHIPLPQYPPSTSARPTPTADSESSAATPTPAPMEVSEDIDQIIKSLGLSRSQAKAYKSLHQPASTNSLKSVSAASKSKSKKAGNLESAKMPLPIPSKKGSLAWDEHSAASSSPPPPPSKKEKEKVTGKAKKEALKLASSAVSIEKESKSSKARAESVSEPSRVASASAPPAEKEERTLFCICNKPYDEEEEGVTMIGCETCDDWFHPECVGIKESSVKSLEWFICANCSSTGKWQAAWKKLCRRNGCDKSSSNRPSKVCSSECGLKHAQSLLGMITDPKALKAIQSLLLGFPKPEIPTSVEEHHLPTPPASPETRSPLRYDATDVELQMQSVQSALKVVEKRQRILDEAVQRCEALSAAANASAEGEEGTAGKGKKTKGKSGGGGGAEDKLCGWEERLIWDDELVEAWVPSSGKEAPDGDVDMDEPKSIESDSERQVCMMPRRRCDRHGGWQKTMSISLDEEARSLNRKLSSLQDEKAAMERTEEARAAGDAARNLLRGKLETKRAASTKTK